MHLSLTGDDKGEESKAAIVKKLSEAYSDSRTDLRYITGRVRVADGRTAREVNGKRPTAVDAARLPLLLFCYLCNALVWGSCMQQMDAQPGR
jgi:hypothetical protein